MLVEMALKTFCQLNAPATTVEQQSLLIVKLHNQSHAFASNLFKSMDRFEPQHHSSLPGGSSPHSALKTSSVHPAMAPGRPGQTTMQGVPESTDLLASARAVQAHHEGDEYEVGSKDSPGR
jgi:hypothetical protein